MDEKLIINIETQVDNSGLDKGISEINKKVDGVEKSIDIQAKIDAVDAAKSVTELKRALRDLQSAALEVGDSNQEALNKINTAAGQARDKIGDLRDGFNSLSGSPIENVATSFASLRQKISSLDIDGVKQQFGNLKLSLVSVAKGFLGIEEGAGLASISISGIGKAIVATGIGALVIAVIALISNFDELKKSGGALGSMLTWIGDKVQSIIKWFKDLSDAIGLTSFAANEATEKQKASQEAYQKGLEETLVKIKEDEAKKKEIAEKAAAEKKERDEKARKAYEDAFKARVKAEDDLAQIRKINSKDQDIAELQNLSEKIVRLEGYSKAELKILGITQTGKELLLAQYNADIDRIQQKAIDDSLAAEKAGYDASNQLLEKQAADRTARLSKNMESAAKAAFEAAANSNLLKQQNEENANKTPFERLQDKFNNWLSNNKEELDKAAEYLGRMSDMVGQIGDAINNIFEIRINRVENAADREMAAAQKTFDANTKGKNKESAEYKKAEEKFAQEKYRIALDTFNKEEKLREKAFKANQAIQIVQAVIGTAQGIVAALSEPIFPLMLARMALAATTGAVQIGLIASQKYQAGQAPTAPTTPSISEPTMNESSNSSKGPDQSFQAAQFFGLGGKQVMDMSSSYQKVFVVESDISGVQKKINVIEDGARFL